MNECWKDIEGYEGAYQVSNLGRVKSLERRDSRGHLRNGKILKTQKISHGYLMLGLYKDGIEKKMLVHRIVAETFIPNTKNLRDVNHMDEIKTNNAVSNLEWCDRSYNCLYGSAQKRRLIAKRLNEIHGLTGLTKKERNTLCVESF